jgi:hypothetical protein
MTASKTARLGLMSPTGSDAFVTTDFSDLTAILDANPGVKPVSNAAGRPSNYTTTQHGSLVLQVDQGILLMWNQPNSGVSGSWQRVGSKGWLATFQNSGTVSTSNKNYSTGPTITSGSVTLPGGRPMLVMWSWDRLGNTNGANVVSYWENSSRIFSQAFYGYDDEVTSGTYWFLRNPASSAAATVNVAMTLNSYNASAPSGSGDTVISNAVMSVFEI